MFSVIGIMEAAAFKDDAGGREHFNDRTRTLRAGLHRGIGHALFTLEAVLAFCAFIFVGRHSSLYVPLERF